MEMTRRERLMATLRGQAVDRPAVNFYEIGGWTPDPTDPDPYNIYNGPGWADLLQLAEEQTDLIRMVHPDRIPHPDNPRQQYFASYTYIQGNSKFTRHVMTIQNQQLTALTRRDQDVSTVWTLESPLKTVDDLELYLQLPDDVFKYQIDLQPLFDAEQKVGDAGIVMVDVADPLCAAAALFSLEDYTIIALTEGVLFHQLLEKLSESIYNMVETVAREFPGHLWRVVGSEYASEPLLPPRLYKEYVVRYTGPMVQTIQKYGGFARLHSHGNLRRILPDIVSMQPSGLDPIEPPPQGDMTLSELRREYGKQMVLFGNIEASELEMLPSPAFEKRIQQALEDGTKGQGRGFVLMPSSCPYGRTITPQVMENYMTMIRLTQQLG
jgi:uroporphyrinogen-III decarboxylase